ncbi:MAG: Flp pilus assembly complex ATPase component TadA [Candidatus Omnitrophica bacterium]|nr:Flp pilus assembly complex ATPase component TadA [Candidatus Omnitrophota bacterium]
MRKSLTAVLVEKNLINNEQLREARQRQQGAKLPIQDVIVEMGFVSEKDMLEVLSNVFQMPIVDLKGENIDANVVNLISYDIAKRYGVFPLRNEPENVVLAMSNPQDIIALDDLKLLVNKSIQPFLASKSDIAICIEKYYHVDDSLYDLLKNIAEDSSVEVAASGSAKGIVQSEMLQAECSPVVRLVKVILSDAIRNRATDIHVEPQENFVEVRYRIDGYLKNILKIPTEMYSQFVARIKIMSNLDIAENKKPQDGRAEIMFKNRKIDLRVSIIPTYYGEKVVLRVLDPQKSKIELSKIGFSPVEVGMMQTLFTRPQGMILVTGPTGSGKTSTLYAALGFVKNETKNIVTIEDPIEYLMDGVNQIQVNPKRDVTFATSLRSVLRQDPDVILVGEIRDSETAEIAFKASLTGHLVFSTLHTNDAVASISRLYDIGLEAYLIASSVVLIIAQRLVRVICPDCKSEYVPEAQERAKFEQSIKKLNIEKFYKGKGCKECGFSGYFGRTAIFEIFQLSKKVQDLISQKASAAVLTQEARNTGMKSLAESGMEKVALGISTLEEVARVAVVDMPIDAPEQKTKREKPLILITDDEDNIRKLVAMRLKTAGFDTIEAINGVEALEMAVRNHPDLIVMDVMMPLMDGFEATKQIRSKLETASIPIVMLTAKGDANSEVQGLDAGADDYIAKPFDGARLLARIKLLLKKKG